MANDPTDPEYSLIQVNKTLSEIIVSICNCGISPKPWPVCTILLLKNGMYAKRKSLTQNECFKICFALFVK